MRVFAYEYLSSGAPEDASAMPSLGSEGWAMLSALLEDLLRCPEVETVTLLDPRRKFAAENWPTGIVVYYPERGNEEQTFRALAAGADLSLIIAPEFDGILERRCRWVEEEGGRLLGSSPDAIRLTADKVTMACHWRKHGMLTPIVLESPSSFAYPLVAKPRYGAGSQATFLLHNDEELARAILHAKAEEWSSPLILQAYCPGLAVSVAFVADDGHRYALPAVEQRLSSDGRFRYLGGRLPLPEHLDRRARCLAERAVECVAGLHGWFGVDLILGAADDGSGDAAIEINPRLTTSYLGLRQLACFNLAEALLAAATGSLAPCRQWRTDQIVFHAEKSTARLPESYSSHNGRHKHQQCR